MFYNHTQFSLKYNPLAKVYLHSYLLMVQALWEQDLICDIDNTDPESGNYDVPFSR